MSDSYNNYNKLNKAKDYDKNRQASAETINQILNALNYDQKSEINKKKKKEILSLGCGTGNYEKKISQLYKIIAIDSSINMIKQAKIKLIDTNVKIRQLDMRNLSIFRENTFDGVYAIQSLHHVAGELNISKNSRFNERLKVFREVRRVLKPSGIFIIIQHSLQQYQAVWFWENYFPSVLEKKKIIQPRTKDFQEWFKKALFKSYTLNSFSDFQTSNYFNSQIPLKKELRASFSPFSLLSKEQLDKGIELLKTDITSGKITKIIQKSKDKFKEIGGNHIIVIAKK